MGLIVDEHDVGSLTQALHDIAPIGAIHVDREPFLTRVQIEINGAMFGPRRKVDRLRHIDPPDFRAPTAKQLTRVTRRHTGAEF